MEKLSWKQFENEINKTCVKYRKTKKAIIQYIHVPVVGNVMKKSTVDFLGCYGPKGKGIAFDAKQTNSKTSFPLSSIHQHQFDFLRYFSDVGGDAYLFIQFVYHMDPDKFYMTPIEFVTPYWQGDKKRKSIPYSEFKEDWIRNIGNFLLYE
jgi:recombination protein U